MRNVMVSFGTLLFSLTLILGVSIMGTSLEATEEILFDTKGIPTMSVGRWNFTERGQKYPCLMAQFALTITVPYNNTNGDVSIAVIKVPPTANVSADSTCGKLVLSWPMMNASTSSTPLFRTPDQVEIAFNNTFRVDAKTNNTTPIFQLANISAVFVYDQVLFPNATKMTSLRLFASDWQPGFLEASRNKSYACDAQEVAFASVSGSGALSNASISSSRNSSTTNNNSSSENITVYADFAFELLRVEPFMQANESKGEFSPATHCSEDRRQSLETRMVPIVVASALGTLVLVVIIAFLIGRRHSRRDYGTVSN